jgi:hypothetical protein
MVSRAVGGWVAGMAEYRVFPVGLDGHFVGSRALTCANDAEAIEQAVRLADGHDVELWSGDRFVTRLVYKPKQSPSGKPCRP